jgi:hypothetical protein
VAIRTWADQQLADLKHHWGDAYNIALIGDRWVAQRGDSRTSFSADSPDGLLALIREDYAQRPVPR